LGSYGVGGYSCVGLVEESYEEAGLNLVLEPLNLITPQGQFRSSNLISVSELTSNESSIDRSVELYGVFVAPKAGIVIALYSTWLALWT
jgi:hypothetical protein